MLQARDFAALRVPAAGRVRASSRRVPPSMRHAFVVVARVGAATLAAAVAAHVLAPAYTDVLAITGAAAALAFELTRVAATLGRRLDELEADIGQTQPLV